MQEGSSQKPEHEYTLKDYRLGSYPPNQGKTIGEGTFGKVKVATHMPTHQKVAVKTLQKSKIADQSDI